MTKTLLYLDIASVINETDVQFSKNSIRLEQIYEGLQKVFSYDFTDKNCDFLITDNTCDYLHEKIMECIPPTCIIRCNRNNKYGSINKGAGLIEKWLYNKDILKKYDYIIHFEPRQYLESFSFFDKFFQSPTALFRYCDPYNDNNQTGFHTGLFSCRVDSILQFLFENPAEKLCKYSISIEYALRDFFKNNQEPYQEVPTLDLLWFPAKGDPAIHLTPSKWGPSIRF